VLEGSIWWWVLPHATPIINLHHIPLLPKPHLPYTCTHRRLPTQGHMIRLA
jgi:hypothetical protein